MLLIIIILFSILVLSLMSNRILKTKENISVPAWKERYVNRVHRLGEQALFIISLAVVSLTFIDFHEFRVFIFLSLIIMFAFNALMEWTFAKENKMYLLDIVTCGLLICGAIVYMLIDPIIGGA
ncbi:DUF4181 domain-containing protein [Salisediminibacterium halotolerans]|nr:DUF4181 domain-containing protein [Salisediminibacterium halotolerans]RLJ72264.1 uncharacterized protein DUF4181 [Actinophytocola xinjiangensis]RPE85478.1 uncharacterized protein DUF4181 [Salisediminibacterium halotolerans]TWG33433.1 uncharacterized protein DUF4181 [Salisediminibacterium halotolerans]GEL07045.1 hypothetical protein SHA02_04610 [Salisediminibacterium halotolerans]